MTLPGIRPGAVKPMMKSIDALNPFESISLGKKQNQHYHRGTYFFMNSRSECSESGMVIVGPQVIRIMPLRPRINPSVFRDI